MKNSLNETFSVIIATYNYGRFIKKAIESILEQDLTSAVSVEIIVVDDGSTDNTASVVENFGSKVKYIYQKNRGQAAAFNVGFSVASGDIIAFLDSDDYWLPEKLRLVAEVFKKDPEIGMAQHFMCEVDINDNPIKAVFEPRKEYYCLGDYLAGKTSFTGTSGLAFRKKYLEKIMPIPEELFYCADEYLYNIIFYSKIYSLNKILGMKKNHGNNWFANTLGNTKRLENHVKVRKVILEKIKEELTKKDIRIADTNIYLLTELAKEEIILYSATGRKIKGLRKLLEFISKKGFSMRYIKMYISLIIAIISASLYSKLYVLYSKLVVSFNADSMSGEICRCRWRNK
ncbi:MAG: Chondroitin synthase [Elusimicrobia bacterium ADurb.Bin231]|nr:MAG: Chondroitin synthase [Elusimicrobia bacterium ADurb.Bin231]